MTSLPRYLAPGWLLAYAVGGCMWMLLIEFTPLPFVLTFAALGLLGSYQIGAWLMGGAPPENRYRALLSGAKTQTRRIVTTREPLQFIGGRGEEADPDKWGWFFDGPDHHGYMVLGRGHDERHDHGVTSIRCPYGEPGDELWVREEHYRYGHWEQVDGPRMRTRTGRQRWRFVADLDEVRFDPPAEFRKGRHHKDPATPAWHKRIARFMPRAFSRITLRIAEVRVQRLQEISEDDARAEGVEPFREAITIYPSRDVRVSSTFNKLSYRPAFIELWDSINLDRAPWSSNPWCWCLTFRRLP